MNESQQKPALPSLGPWQKPADSFCFVYADTGEAIANCETNDVTLLQAHVNAQFIAAAPTMFSALAKILELLSSNGNHMRSEDWEDAIAEAEKAIRVAKKSAS